MKAQQHSEYELEQVRLQETLVALNDYIHSLEHSPAGGADAHTTAVLQAKFAERGRRFRTIEESPYFGRIDFTHHDDSQPSIYYIGKEGFEHKGRQVINWRAPLASLYYQGKPGHHKRPAKSFRQPDLSGELWLKRTFEIRTKTLVDIADEFDVRDAVPGRERAVIVDPDEYLRRVLQSKRDIALQDIVATIQAQQYELIHAPLEQVLVVQGVAGSGKTSIALHRMAFLLYPDNAPSLDAKRCIIFGPNRLFLHYIAQVLPGLGVEHLTQTTLDDWACEMMGQPTWKRTDRVLDLILSPTATRDEKAEAYRQSQLKNSHRMSQLLEALVAQYRQGFRPPEAGLTYTGLGPIDISLSLSATEVTEIWSGLSTLPLAQHRTRFLETVQGRLAGQYDTAVEDRAKTLAERGERLLTGAQRLRDEAQQLDTYSQFANKAGDADLTAKKTAASIERGRQGLLELADYCQRQGEPIVLRARRLRDEALETRVRRQALDMMSKALQKDIDRFWPALNPIEAYFELLANEEHLKALNPSLFKPKELELLHQPGPQGVAEVDLSDLAAIHFLHTIVNGVPVGLYDHIVIDEAQDVSPLQLDTLRLYSRNNSVTVLGDLAQSIYAHRGLSNWDEVRAAFPDGQYSYQEVKRSYRSTFEIMRFANRVLQATTPKGRPLLLAEPFERHGKPPQIHRLKYAQELPGAVTAIVRQMQHDGYSQIAIIGKTTAQCATIADGLRQESFTEFELALSSDFDYRGGTLVVPVHLAKGMEFEVALIVNANDKTYTATEYDGRLLYVALTRGLHELHICIVGNPSRFITEQ